MISAIIAGVMASASLVAGAATPTPQPISKVPPLPPVTVYPAELTGPQTSHGTYTVRNAGKTTENVSVTVYELVPAIGWNHKAWVASPDGPYRDVTISPAHFKVPAHSDRTFRVSVKSRDGYAHNLTVAIKVQGPALKNGASVSEAISPLFKVQGRPNPYAAPVNAGRPIVARPSDALGLASMLTGATALVLLCIGLVWRRKRRNQPQRRYRHA